MPGGGGPEHGLAAVALAGEQPLGHQPAQARAHLVAGQPAGLGDGVELVGHDGAVVVGHAQHEHPRRDLDVGRRPAAGRFRHDRTLLTTAAAGQVHSQLGPTAVRGDLHRRGGRTPSCRGRPSGPSGDRRGRRLGTVQGMQPIDR